ncbi:ENTH domain-containing, putative [Babesia ovis]|uniref:ENTH domain-containing, putative n=1 Tax=Babesia ovis TaxID=5869 RepID=A0A9W5WWK8_BABOV|nr:ENTH domain-containing, putative [Babesia ovis]
MEGTNASKQQVLLLTISEINKRLKQALYSSDAGCPETVFYELSQATHDVIFRERIFKATWRCLNSSVSRCRRIQKALTLLMYLVLNGHEACISEIFNHIDEITALHNLVFPVNSRDIECIIKEKAVNLVNLVCDPKLVAKKRREVEELRSRFVGVTSNKGRVETQVLHKPIYTVDPKNTISWSLPQAATQKWNALSQLIKNTGVNLNKKYNIFDRAKHGSDYNHDSTDTYPLLRSVGDKTDVSHPNRSSRALGRKYKTLGNPEYTFRNSLRQSSESSFSLSTSDSGSYSSGDSSDYDRHRRSAHRRSVDSLSESTSTSNSSWGRSQELRKGGSKNKEYPSNFMRTKNNGYRNELVVSKYDRPMSMDHIGGYVSRMNKHAIDDLGAASHYKMEHGHTLAEHMGHLSIHSGHQHTDAYPRSSPTYRIDDLAAFQYDHDRRRDRGRL